MKRIWGSLIGFAALVAANSALAQTSFPTQNTGVNAQGVVAMCKAPDGAARPCDGLTPLPVTVTAGVSGIAAEYPPGSIPISCIGAGSTGAVVATCAAAPGKVTYLCGFDLSAIGGTAAVGPVVIAGLNGGSFTYQVSSTAAGTLISRDFTRCIPSATQNTAITITTTADGTATAVDVNGYGYQL